MSTYAQRVREEIFSSKPLKGKYCKAFSYGILLMGKKFQDNCLAISTENIETSKLYGFAISDIVKIRPAFSEHVGKNGTTLYNCCLSDVDSIKKLMEYFQHEDEDLNREIITEESFPQFLSGVFMACGSISDPEKIYHMEFVPPNEEKADILFEMLSQAGYPPKASLRRGQTVLYFKESSQIEDLLTLMGAVKSSLTLMETKIVKDLRNRANRATNCETANIDKLVKAAVSQKEDILYLMEQGAFDSMPPSLKETARLRLENPDMSLSQLASLCGASRSGVNHRLDKICKIAKTLKSGGEI